MTDWLLLLMGLPGVFDVLALLPAVVTRLAWDGWLS